LHSRYLQDAKSSFAQAETETYNELHIQQVFEVGGCDSLELKANPEIKTNFAKPMYLSKGGL
jgi:hypothetical protein